jgi:hypothetical protein
MVVTEAVRYSGGNQMTPSRTVEAGAPLWIGRILAYVTGTVDQELLAGTNEYLTAENLILKAQLKARSHSPARAACWILSGLATSQSSLLRIVPALLSNLPSLAIFSLITFSSK